jgi:hypothetical protein
MVRACSATRLLVEGEMVEDLARIAHVRAADDGKGMRADGGNGGDVGREAAGAARVAGVEHHHAGRSGFLGFGLGGAWFDRCGISHGPSEFRCRSPTELCQLA